MVRICASKAASSLAACQRPRRAPLQEAQDPEFEPKVVMEDVESDDAARDRLVLVELIREASTPMDEEDAELVYEHTRFRRDKVRCRYFSYYHERKIMIERGATIEEFDERAPRVRVVLDAQGWIDMVEDRRPTMEAIVWEFYANLYQRRSAATRSIPSSGGQ
jgi:hypothetical protein